MGPPSMTTEDRAALLETLSERLLAKMFESVPEVLQGLDDEKLRALITATEGDDPVAQALAERFVFRRAAEAAMTRARELAKTRSDDRREAAKTPPDPLAPPSEPNSAKPSRADEPILANQANSVGEERA